jgi:hypothetical protein
LLPPAPPLLDTLYTCGALAIFVHPTIVAMLSVGTQQTVASTHHPHAG